MKHHLFTAAQPDSGGKDFLASLNPNSLKVIQAVVESSLASAKAGDKFQFERHGYFGCGITSLREVSLRRNAPARCVADRVDHAGAKPVFNLAVGLKDSWGK